MYKKLEAGNISFAHFSDVLRLMLLAKYGGVWVDSTLLMTGDYLKLVDGYSFFTVKHKTDEGWHISDGSWATFFLACTPNDPVICFCRDMHLAYWKRENCLLCYLIFDCFLSIGYDSIPIIHEEIERVPINNSGVFDILYGRRNEISTSKELGDSDRIVSLSKMTEVDLVKAFGVDPNNIMTIYNACDPDLIMNLAKKEKYKVPTYDYIVTTGRLMKQKGQWHLIKAFSEVHKRIPDLHLVILGEGELESGLKKITTGLGLQDYVHFMGFVKSPHRYMYWNFAYLVQGCFCGFAR